MRQLFAGLWAGIAARLFNFYTLRAVIVAAVSAVLTAIAPALPPQLVAEIQKLIEVAGAGDRAATMLAFCGLGYVLVDLLRKGSGAAVNAGTPSR